MDNFLIGFLVGAFIFSILVLALCTHNTNSQTITTEAKEFKEKDPTDNSENGSCTSWTFEEYCPSCFGGIRTSDILAKCCPMCGESIGILNDTNAYGKYVFRKIYYKGSWKYQYKNHQGPCENQIREIPFKRMV